MKFEVFNDRGVPKMSTEYISCIPDSAQLAALSKAGYKFKINGKPVSKKKVEEYIKTNTNKQTKGE